MDARGQGRLSESRRSASLNDVFLKRVFETADCVR